MIHFKKNMFVSLPKLSFLSKIDRFTLYSFDGPFQLLHADVANLEFLDKSAVDDNGFFLFLLLKLILIQWNQESLLAKNEQILWRSKWKKKKQKKE